MADDKKKRGKDGTLVAATQPYEVKYFARKYGLDVETARKIIEEHGPSRRACDAAARAFLDAKFQADGQADADRADLEPDEPAAEPSDPAA